MIETTMIEATMTGTKPSAMTTNVDTASGPRVVYQGNDGIWLNFNPQMRGSVRGGFMQHVRGVTGSGMRQPGPLGKCDIGGRQCLVWRLKAPYGRFDVAVMNPEGVRPFLLSAQGNQHGGFGIGGLSVHVHAALIERVGEVEAVASARRWVNALMLCLPTPQAIVACELVSRIDYAVDVLVEKGGPDDYGPAVHEQLISRLQHPKMFWKTGWEIGRGDAGKDRLKRVITSYDKFQERWDRKGFAGLQEYVTNLGDSSLAVEEDGRVVQVGENGERQQIRGWRIEFRFHRTFLQGEGIGDANEAILALPALVAAACPTTSLRQRCTTGKVFATNPVTPLWKCVIMTVT